MADFNRKPPEEHKKTQNISFDPALLETAIQICQIEERGISSLVTLALKQYIRTHYPDGVS